MRHAAQPFTPELDALVGDVGDGAGASACGVTELASVRKLMELQVRMGAGGRALLPLLPLPPDSASVRSADRARAGHCRALQRR